MKKHEIDRLLFKIGEGDNDAFKQLYIETKRGVYAFLYSYFRNRADCEDALQTVYLKIKQNAYRYNRGTNGLAWILEIAKNTALNALRAENNYRKAQELATAVSAVAPVDCVDGVCARDSVMSAMKAVLTEEEQRIVILHVIWAYKHKEIAEIIGLPLGTVTSKYKRAVDKLKNKLKEDGQ